MYDAWHVNQDESFCGGKPVIIWGPFGPGHGAVAYTSEYGFQVRDVEAVRKKACLIAAAPQLLSAAKETLECLAASAVFVDLSPFQSLIDAVRYADGELCGGGCVLLLGHSGNHLGFKEGSRCEW